ncbi:MAG: hypothetical protein ACK44L_01055 [Burkholderiales bacterium]
MDALPETFRQEVVMSDSAIDGQSVRTWRFRSDQSAQSVSDAAQAHFREIGRQVIAVTRGEWRIVSALAPDGIYTVQVRSTARGAEGLSSVWARPDSGIAPVSGHVRRTATALDELQDWLPDSVRVLRRITHHDSGRLAGTLVASSGRPSAEIVAWIQERARRAGYQPDPVLGMPAQRAGWYRGDTGEALALRRRGDELIATLAPQGEATSIVMHWSRAQ